jgi:predicted dehydrogenase
MTPKRVTAVASIAKTHPIETEDEVSAILEYPNGAVGHYMTTTGEAPGSNRLEIAGDRGLIVCADGKLLFRRTRVSVKQHRETDKGMFSTPESWETQIPYQQVWADHKIVTQNFVNAILKDEPLIAPGTEGVKGLEIGNAMLMAGLTRKPVDLPMDGEAYEKFLKDLAKKYGGKKTLQTQDAVMDMQASFKK